jgi:hypothetical protein
VGHPSKQEPNDLEYTLQTHALIWLLCLAAFLIYIPSLTYDFIRDDHYQIVKNPQIQSWSYVGRLLTSDVGRVAHSSPVLG